MSKNTLVISDIHLGSPVSKVKAIVKVLKNEDYSHLIINGDLFDNKHIERYKKQHWKVLSILRKIAKKKEITFILGNHDVKSKNIIKILGLDFVERYEKTINGKHFLFMHFQQFDPFIFKYPFITNLAEQIYYFFQKIDRSRKIARFLKRNSKSFLNIRHNIRTKAISFINGTKHDAIVGGHIHYAEIYKCPFTSKEYYNSGSFCDDPCHYLIIDGLGCVHLKEV